MSKKCGLLKRLATHRQVVLLSGVLIAGLLLSFVLLDALYPLDQQRLERPLSTRVYDREGRLLRMHLSTDGFWRFPAASADFPALLKKAVIHFEDRFFEYHLGVNPLSLLRAAWHNLFSDRRIGGSTLTMQVARMMYRRPRTFNSKCLEIFNALQLEYHYTKDEILRFYLNLAPYGGNIEGVAAAAWLYFNKPLDALSVGDIALLTTIPKNPNANRPDRTGHLEGKRRRVIALMKKNGIIKRDQAERALSETLVARRYKPAFTAPHFTRLSQVLAENKTEVNSCLDRTLYNFIRRLLHQTVDRLKTFDVRNAAAVIIHNPTMAIRAWVGSHDFYDAKNGGQNDGVVMVRSPGSALKPFVYALAFDAGLITPRQQVFDVPIHIEGYIPRNFNLRYYGLVSAAEALQASLNIPAIELNRLLGKSSLYELLRRAGIATIDQGKAYYGAGIAVGGLGISLLDLTHLYTALANGGKLQPLRFQAAAPLPTEGVRLFSESAAYITSEILADGYRKEFSSHWESIEDIPKVAFKTGTSAGGRDLVTIGYNPEFTVGIWLGNFNGRPTRNLTGIDAASGVMFETFRYLERFNRFEWFPRPERVRQQELCSDALAVGDQCRDTQPDWTIAGIALRRPCELLRAEVLEYLFETGRIRSMNDLRYHRCYDHLAALKPEIASPHHGAAFTLAGWSNDQGGRIPLKCYSFQRDPAVYWFIDDQAPVVSRSGQTNHIKLDAGAHRIACLDSHSQIARSEITINKE